MPKVDDDGPPDDEQRPTVRLAHKVNNQGDRTLEEGPPTLRLARPARRGESDARKGLEAPALRLATCDKCGNTGGDNLLRNLTDPSLVPALLVSYVYLQPFLANEHKYQYRDWALDSGAFSAHNSGEWVILEDYIDCYKRLADHPAGQKLVEVFALDVIGDWRESVHNAELMWKVGIEAIPTFHYGMPWDVLKGLARDYPKVAIGGCVGKRDKDKFAGQCFGRVWPHALHGFGFGSEKSLMMYPWHSVDATNWEIAPVKYGHWKAFGGQRVSVRGSRQNLRAEVEWYLDLERRARERWREEMKKLVRVENPAGPSLRLAHGGDATSVSNRGTITRMKAFGADSEHIKQE